MKRKENNKPAEEKQYINVDWFEVKRAFDTGKTVYFDLELNGVTIYGCRVVEGQQGDFIGFPSQKGKDGRYYNICYAPLAPENVQGILDVVEKMINA